MEWFHFIWAGLILDILGAGLILFPIIERLKDRLRVYLRAKKGERIDYNPWDFYQQNPGYHKRNDILSLVGFVLLVSGFILQLYGNNLNWVG